MNDKDKLLLALPAVVAAEVRRNRGNLRGDKGDKGDRGEKGERGETGGAGRDGKDGLRGRDGKDGAPSMVAGPRGEKGERGERGETIIRQYEIDEAKLKETFDGWLTRKINFFGGTAAGPIGPAGPAGVGVPAGGTSGQVLTKLSGTDYDTAFSTFAAGGASWGAITGTLSSQTDLQNALDAKENATTFAAIAFSGAYGDLTGAPALASVATSGAYGDLSGLPALGTVASTAASTWALAVSSYVYAAQLAGVATSGSYGSLTGTPTLGTVASTAASTWALAASSYVYQAQLGTAASTNAANYASSTHKHDALDVTSGVFAVSRLASTGTPNATAFLAGNTTWVAFSGVTTSGAYGSLSGTPTLGTVASTAASTWAFATAVPSLSFSSSFAGATIALGTNTYSTVASISLGAGTWWVEGSALAGQNVATTTKFTGKITDGTNNFVSAQQGITANTSTYASISVGPGIVVLGATSTLSLAVAASVTGAFVRAQAWQNAAGSTASFISAIRIK